MVTKVLNTELIRIIFRDAPDTNVCFVIINEVRNEIGFIMMTNRANLLLIA